MGNKASRAKSTTLLCTGDPILDLVCTDVPVSFVEGMGFAIGGCDAIDEQALEEILSKLNSDKRTLCRVPGGSAANVAKCFARLTSRNKCANVYFAGTLGSDPSGEEYRKAMEAVGVEMSQVSVHPSEANGVCLCLVTESGDGRNGERTMRTALRASKTHELDHTIIQEVRPTWAHFEGYYVYKGSILDSMRALKEVGAKISFDLASADVIASKMEVFEEILAARLIDVLFCNKEEAMAFAKQRKKASWGGRTLNSPQKFAQAMAEMHGLTMVISLGSDGCVAAAWDSNLGEVVHGSAPAESVVVVDTIGAGDHFSAGFLYALSQGKTLSTACQCGCIAGAAAVQVSGANVDDRAMRGVTRKLAKIMRQ